MQISIVLLTHNHLETIQQSLEHIRKNVNEPYELIVVNNGSNQKTIEYLQEQDDLQFITKPDKPGIARGYNLGAELAGGKYILFMMDYCLLTENCLSSMLNCLQNTENIAMAGPVSNDVSGYQRVVVLPELADPQIFANYNRLQNLGASQQVFRLLSHCLLVKKEVLDNIGFFDEIFGLGTYEDDDLCYRAVTKGYDLYIALDAFVYYINPMNMTDFDREEFFNRLKENRQKAIDKWGFDISDFLLKIRNEITISLCMIVKNEEKTLPRCLDSVKDIVDEIIIVDTGSGDNTKAIAEKYTNKIYDFVWIDDFAAARNFSFAQATMEYILWLDADDYLKADDQEKLLHLKKNLDPAVDSVTMQYNLGFDQYNNVISSLRRNRLVKRRKQFQWIGVIHEYLAVYGCIMDSEIAVTHARMHQESKRNLMIYERLLSSGHQFSPRDMYYFANELYEHGDYERAIEYYNMFLKTEQGWIEDVLASCRKMAECYKGLGDHENEYLSLLKAFRYEIPRSDIACRLGFTFMDQGRFKEAAFWYKLATELEKPSSSWGFIDHACWTWLPHLQLCVCYDRLGEYQLAYDHNEIAGAYLPDDSRILHNRKYLETKLAK